MKRLRESINRSAAQHLRHVRLGFQALRGGGSLMSSVRGQQNPDDSMRNGLRSVRSPAPLVVSDATDKRWALIQTAEEAGEEFFMAAGRIDGHLAGA